eukprot:s1620_g2.t1
MFHFYHLIDQATNFHVAIPAPSRAANQAIAKASEAWFQWAGPPNTLVMDPATEFTSEEFEAFLQRHDVHGVVTAPHAHWQNGRCERHDQIIQGMLDRLDAETPITTFSELQQALIQLTHAKNCLSIRRGYSPEILVFGNSPKLPGSITSSDEVSAHESANREDAWGIRFRQSLELRERARVAFHRADNDMALRRACLRRSRPDRKGYGIGEWVMMWQPVENKPRYWFGPLKVTQQETNLSVWATMSGKLHRRALEHVRPVSSMEARQLPMAEGEIDNAAKSHPVVDPTLPETTPEENQAVPRTIVPSSFDIRAAFLQGRPQQDRVMGLEPVPELSKAMQLKPDEVCNLDKSAYGLIDAPYLWFQTLKEELSMLGMQQSPFDPCVYILRHPNSGKLSGILGVHVDDGIHGGDEYFQQQIAKLEAKYPLGSKKSKSFTFTGIDMQQQPDNSIHLSQTKYVNSIQPITLKAERRAQENETVTEPERHLLRGLIGSLQYAAVHTRPGIASALSHLQSEINKATLGTLITANKVLHTAKKHSDVTIKIKPIAANDVRLLAFSDASFASKSKPESHAGMIIMATHKEISQNKSCDVSPISWGTKKIQRIVTSTLSRDVSIVQCVRPIDMDTHLLGLDLEPKS